MTQLSLAEAVQATTTAVALVEQGAGECWKLCCEGFYEVSDHGCVRRAKSSARGNGVMGRLLAIQVRLGYHVVPIWIKGKCKNWFVHRLVAEAFIGPRPDGLFVNHKDGKKGNNRPANLEYVTTKENIQHSLINELRAHGERCTNAKLTDEQVKEIRILLGHGILRAHLAEHYGVAFITIDRIATGKSWKRVV